MASKSDLRYIRTPASLASEKTLSVYRIGSVPEEFCLWSYNPVTDDWDRIVWYS